MASEDSGASDVFLRNDEMCLSSITPTGVPSKGSPHSDPSLSRLAASEPVQASALRAMVGEETRAGGRLLPHKNGDASMAQPRSCTEDRRPRLSATNPSIACLRSYWTTGKSKPDVPPNHSVSCCEWLLLYLKQESSFAHRTGNAGRQGAAENQTASNNSWNQERWPGNHRDSTYPVRYQVAGENEEAAIVGDQSTAQTRRGCTLHA